MAILVKISLFMCFHFQHLWIINAATLPPMHHLSYQMKTPQKYSEYLAPYTTENSAEKSINYSSNIIRQPTYQKTKMFYPITQNHNKNFSNSNQSTKKIYSSYAAPASGSASFVYSMPQPSNLVPLPTLFPKSLVEQYRPVSGQQQQQYQESRERQQQIQQQQQQQQYIDQTKSNDLPLLMFEEPTSALLTPNQSRSTLEAARILASTLLQINGEAPLETPGLAPLSNPNALDLPNNLTSTDFFIVKSQKNAYIIPTPLAKDARNPPKVQALYQMRDQLDKAYTINQFIFIIKPEKINFLNKLV